jgi:hypothetical protein
VFGLADEDILGVSRHLFDVLSLVDATSEGFSKFEKLDRQKFLEPIEPIRRVVKTSLANLRAGHSGLLSPISDRHMTLLELGADEWERQFPEPKVDEKNLKEILKQTTELRNTVREATDINSELRSLLLSMLASIEDAIDQSKIMGPAALENGLIQVLGQSRWAWIHMEKPPEKSVGGKLLKKVGAIVVALTAAMTFANTTHKTIETFGPDILLLTSNPEIPPVSLPDLNVAPDSQVKTEN